MKWKSGQSGNPLGRMSEQAYTNCLRAALNEEDPKKKRRYLQLGAERVAVAFAEGEPWAVTHVADRLDGKPHQTSETTIHNRPVTEMTTAELLRIAAQGRTDEPQVTEDGTDTKH
jgi:hypothetical protein